MRSNGFSLALTLWIVAIMSLASALYLSYAKAIVTKSQQLNTKLQLTFEAESVIELIKFYGATGEFRRRAIFNSNLSRFVPNFPKKLYLDSHKMVWRSTQIILQDSAGLLNVEDIDAIVNYLIHQSDKLKDKKDIIRDSIRDWLDRDNFSRLNGAEDEFYKKYSYRARSQGYFASTDEFFLIRGVEELNKTVKRRLSTLLVQSHAMKRNVATMNSEMLQSIYNISKINATLLERVKGADDFVKLLTLFHSIYKENYDLERDGFAPSKVVKVEVVSSKNGISKRVEFLIDFSIYNQRAFAILNYKD
jgi:type II secretory pathway component PulK